MTSYRVPLDKQLHFLWCFAICILASMVHPIAGVAAAIVAGLLKEWHDSKQEGNAWSWGDIAFDAAGTVLAAVAVWILQS